MTLDFTCIHNNSIFNNQSIIQENIIVYTLSDQYEYKEQDINNNTLTTHNGEPICAKSISTTCLKVIKNVVHLVISSLDSNS